MNFLRDLVVPLMSLTTLVGCVYFTYKMIELGSVGGAISVGLLAAGNVFFVVYDAKRLLAKIS